MGRKLVAVYGTLKQGGSNYDVTAAGGGKFLGKAKTIHSYCMYGGWGYPRVTHDAAISPIQVEVFEMNTFGTMDALEGHPNFFCREQIPVAFDDVLDGENDVEVAWMYFHPPIGKPTDPCIVMDGKWPQEPSPSANSAA